MAVEWERFSDSERLKKTVRCLKNALRIGWDEEYGGICLFRDFRGGEPTGTVLNPEEPMYKKATEDKYSKLWWVHSEAMYTTLLCYKKTKDEDFLRLFEKVFDYTYKTFPNPNREIGEWIQIRTRDGKPQEKVVALPVKDPYHIIRNVILIIELLEGKKEMKI